MKILCFLFLHKLNIWVGSTRCTKRRLLWEHGGEQEHRIYGLIRPISKTEDSLLPTFDTVFFIGVLGVRYTYIHSGVYALLLSNVVLFS